jgi:hypothetical protein
MKAISAAQFFRRGTPHRLSRGFLAWLGGVEGRAGFEHGAGDVEEAVSDRSQGSAMAMTAAAELGVFGAGTGIALHGHARPMVAGVGEAGAARLGGGRRCDSCPIAW